MISKSGQTEGRRTGGARGGKGGKHRSLGDEKGGKVEDEQGRHEKTDEKRKKEEKRPKEIGLEDGRDEGEGGRGGGEGESRFGLV